MLKSQIKISVRKPQRLQTKASWKSHCNVQQSRSQIAFEFEIAAFYSSYKLERYYHAYKLGHKVRLKIYVAPDNLFPLRGFEWNHQFNQSTVSDHFGNRLTNGGNTLWPFKSDTINKRNDSVWYDFNSKRIHVDVWVCWWRSGVLRFK